VTDRGAVWRSAAPRTGLGADGMCRRTDWPARASAGVVGGTPVPLPIPICPSSPPDRCKAERHARHSLDGLLAPREPNAPGTQRVSVAAGHRRTKNLCTIAVPIELATNPADTSKCMRTRKRRTTGRRTDQKKHPSAAFATGAPAGPPRSSPSLQASKVSDVGLTGV